MERNEFESMAPPLRERIVAMVIRMSADIDEDLADDVAQDTLLRLWTMRDRLETYRSVEALAMVIARNRAIDLLRERSAPTISLDDFDRADHSPTPEETMIGHEETDALHRILSTLPSGQQAVIRMKHIEGLEINEIASITGSTPGAIRVTLSRARHHIKELFMQSQYEHC